MDRAMPVQAFIAQSGRSVISGSRRWRPSFSKSSRRSISMVICGHSQQCSYWMRRSLRSSVSALNGPTAGTAVSDPLSGPSVCSSDAGGVAMYSRCCACESCECHETPCAVRLCACAQRCETCAWPTDSHRSQTMRKPEFQSPSLLSRDSQVSHESFYGRGPSWPKSDTGGASAALR